jgi:hypothetical protein
MKHRKVTERPQSASLRSREEATHILPGQVYRAPHSAALNENGVAGDWNERTGTTGSTICSRGHSSNLNNTSSHSASQTCSCSGELSLAQSEPSISMANLTCGKTPWPEFANELYRRRGSRLSAKLVPTFADRRCLVVSVTDPYRRILGF